MRREFRSLAIALLFTSVNLSFTMRVMAQEGGEVAETATEEAQEQKRKANYLVLPVPFSDPSTGFGIGALGVAFYNPNGGPHQWTTGFGGVWTSRGSKGVAGVHKMSSADDHFRLAATASWFDRNDRYYGIGANAGDRDQALDLDVREINLKLRGVWEITERAYLGFQYTLLVNDAVANADSAPDVIVPPEDQLDSTMSAIGPVAVYDTRDNHDQPTKGVHVAATWMLGMKALGDSFSHNMLTVQGNAYRAVREDTVIAGRASFCSAGGDAAYYALCRYGSSKNLRGYPSDRYRDRASWTVQGEVRRQFSSRWGGAAFAGIGGIAPSAADLFADSNFLPAGGFGVRYRPFRKNDVRIRLDLAFGKDSNGLYLSFGEAY
ncbi:MAG TPA: BamA/TamA family outer membrane protein [Steroidobacteraceae bacterium]|nr:BamA/TamA family outer membrane protein [Steroidobacteraceae bacterium]